MNDDVNFEEKIIIMMLHIVSRQDAIKFGLKKYFTGIRCPHGHLSERLISNMGCSECSRIYSNKRYNSIKDDDEFKKLNRQKTREYRENNKDKVNKSNVAWAKKNREMLNERARTRYRNDNDYYKKMAEIRLKNSEYMKRYLKDYYNKNKDALISKQKEYNIENKEKIMDYKRGWQRKRNKTPIGIVTAFSRKAIHRAAIKKSDRTFALLGYESKKLIERIEYTFSEGMSWKNYGDWHIDHIIPIAHFFKKGVTDIKTINSLCNIRALWKEDNLKKSDKHPLGDSYAI